MKILSFLMQGIQIRGFHSWVNKLKLYAEPLWLNFNISTFHIQLGLL